MDDLNNYFYTSEQKGTTYDRFRNWYKKHTPTPTIFDSYFNPIIAGGAGVFRSPSDFAAFRDSLKANNIEMLHADCSFLSIY